jgi:Uma2 family endonuclease
MFIEQRLYTIEDLRAIESLPENKDKRFELLKGVICEVAYPMPEHNLIMGNVYDPLKVHVKVNQLGYVFTDSVIYELPNGDRIAPDVSFVAKGRAVPPFSQEFTIAPDFAVEIRSPSNAERELLDKAESLLECGTKLVWIAYPKKRVVDVCRLASDGSLNIRKMDIHAVLDGEDVLPGFKLAVKDIFDIYGT